MSKRRVVTSSCFQCHLDLCRARKAERYATEPAFALYNSARSRAKREGVLFKIKQTDIEAIWPDDNKCPILKIELERNVGKCGPQRQSPSLDRVNPAKGYIKGNIAVLSYKANCIKQNETDPAIFRAIAEWLESQDDL